MFCRYGLQQTDGANEFIPSIVEGFRKEIKLCNRGEDAEAMSQLSTQHVNT
jgi:hypothetical protein